MIPDLKKYANVKVIGTLMGLVLIVLVWKNGKRWWEQLTKQDKGHYADLTSFGEVQAGNEQANQARQAQLEKMAQDTYTALNSTLMIGGVTATGREFQLELINALNDSELRYVAQFYEHNASSTGQSLKQDLDDEFMPATDVDERLIARLNQLAL
ncbi:MAG: hypothetical protein JST38_02575 [Bacteroidetes bacterium]|nr:hypothetical protein [Bacteroidota bacterium]